LDGQVTVSMSFEEKRADDKDQNVITMDRKIFFRYKLTPDTAAAAAPVDTAHVNQVDALPPANTNDAAAAPAPGPETAN